MGENWQNARLINHLQNEGTKLVKKQIEFKDFHGKNFTFIEEEKDSLTNYLDSLNVDAYKDIDYNEELGRKLI